MKYRRRKKNGPQMVNQDEVDIAMTRESAIGGTEIHPEEIHRSEKDDAKRNPNTRIGGHIGEMMNEKDTEGEEKTTTTMVGKNHNARVEADLLGAVKISTKSKTI
jgi:hypothetical protein